VPKIKTHKPTSKRFRISQGGNGKLMRTKQGKSHLRRKKARRARAELDEMFVVDSPGIRKRIRRLAPYLGSHS
jgi:large subunit ribosomal protein L35